jgi:hypothetical protein
MKRPSAALVVALVALFASLGGVGVAAQGLITGAQIKDHSIGMVDLSNLAVAKLKGQRGPEGEPGQPGPQGPPGGFDPNKVTYVQSSNYSVPPFSVVQQAVAMKAMCPTGSKAIAGGSFHGIALLGASLPLPDGSGWSVIIINDTSIQLDGLYAFAVCAAR